MKIFSSALSLCLLVIPTFASGANDLTPTQFAAWMKPLVGDHVGVFPQQNCGFARIQVSPPSNVTDSTYFVAVVELWSSAIPSGVAGALMQTGDCKVKTNRDGSSALNCETSEISSWGRRKRSTYLKVEKDKTGKLASLKVKNTTGHVVEKTTFEVKCKRP